MIFSKTKILTSAIIFLLLTAVGIFWCWHRIGVWLSASDDPLTADLIICLNGEYRVSKAANLFQQGLADRILLMVDGAADPLLKRGVPADRVHNATGARTTFEEALVARAFVQANPPAVALVVSDPYHIARVRWTFTTVFDHLPIHLVFVASDLPWPAATWFADRHSRYLVASEISKMAFYRTYHGFLGKETVPDWVRTLKSAYLRFLRKILFP